MTTPTLHVLIGSPGSGKSTWCRTHQHHLGAVLSLDAARAELGTGEADQTVTGPAVTLTRQRAIDLLAAGHSATIDATGAHHADRADWLALARQHRARTVAVIFRTPLSTCLARNHQRDRTVPETVVRRMWQTIHRTSRRSLRRQGFDQVDQIR